jgi:hypothetical protein
MLERDHTLLDHVQELVLLGCFVVFGFVLGRVLAEVLRPKPAAVLLSPEQMERNRAEAEKRWREEQAEQRRLLALEIAEQLRGMDPVPTEPVSA